MLNLEDAIRKSGRSKMQLALKAEISPADFYQALNGKRPFFPAWRRRIAQVLEIPEDQLFPEYQEAKKEV